MAKGIRDIKRQIKSKQSMKQMTKAMEMVAASKLRKLQERAQAARPYTEKMKEMIDHIASSLLDVEHPMLQKREIKKTGYLVITSDRGLAGGYNANVLRKTMQLLRDNHQSADEYALMVVGRKGRDYFKRRDMPIIDEVIGLPDTPKFSDIKALASAAVKHYGVQHYDALYLIYNEFINAVTQVPVQKQLLPLESVAHTGAAAQYEYEPSAEGVLGVLLPQYAETLVYSALLEGKASEFGARMTAMGNATKNATTMISDLQLAYNRARQAAITQEISEIVAGANALS